MAVRTIDVLRAARKLVANPETWNAYKFASAADGKRRLPLDGDAVRWCAIGAIHKAGGLDIQHYFGSPLDIALDILATRHGHTSFAAANDDGGQTAALAVIDDAIAELEAQ